MKIAHVFNMANNAYQICKALRNKGLDVELILQSLDFGMSMPFWEELELDINPYDFRKDPNLIHKCLAMWDRPNWIRIWWKKKLNRDPEAILSLFKITKKYDLLHLHPASPIYLQFANKPYIIHEAGWIRRIPYTSTFAARLARRAYANAECIVMTNPDTYEILHKIPYKKERFIPFIIDPEQYKPVNVEKPEKPTFFHPTRHVWSKGNWKVIKAFHQFIKQGGNAKLQMVNWGDKEELTKSHTMVDKLGIKKHVKWAPRPYSKPKLIEMYNKSTAVLDGFIRGSGGTTCYESMSCEAPTIIHLNGWNKIAYGEMPPVINVKTTDEICREMHRLVEDENYGTIIGSACRDFVKRHNAPNVVADQFIELYEEVEDEKFH